MGKKNLLTLKEINRTETVTMEIDLIFCLKPEQIMTRVMDSPVIGNLFL